MVSGGMWVIFLMGVGGCNPTYLLGLDVGVGGYYLFFGSRVFIWINNLENLVSCS